ETVEGTFEWYDQSPVVYTNCAPGEPNQSGDEDCTQVYANGTWIDLNCNTANAKSIIEVNLCPVITAPDVIVCANEPATVAALNPVLGSSPYTFTWRDGATTQSQTVPTVDASYIVSDVDRYGCSGQDTATVTTKPVPSVSASPIDTLICTGQTAEITFSADLANTAISWIVSPTNVSGASNGNGATVSQTLTATAAVNGTVTYIATPTLNGCTGQTASANVTVSPLPTITISPNNPTICLGDSIQLTTGGANTYAWSPNNGLNTTTGSSVNASPNSNQTYTVVGTNIHGCENSSNILVTVKPIPELTITPA